MPTRNQYSLVVKVFTALRWGARSPYTGLPKPQTEHLSLPRSYSVTHHGVLGRRFQAILELPPAGTDGLTRNDTSLITSMKDRQRTLTVFTGLACILGRVGGKMLLGNEHMFHIFWHVAREE